MPPKKAKKKIKISKRNVRYGMIRITGKEKLVWLSVQNKNGWSLGLAMNGFNVWLRNTRFVTRKEVESVFDKRKVVFIELKNNPEKNNGGIKHRKIQSGGR
jgi:hypothetical protein